MLWLLGLTIMFFIGYTVYESGLAYYVLYCAGLSEGAMSTAMLLNIFISIVMTAIISKFTQYTDQRIAMAVCFAIAAACCMLFPITKKKYYLLMEQKANKEAGKEADKSELKRII